LRVWVDLLVCSLTWPHFARSSAQLGYRLVAGQPLAIVNERLLCGVLWDEPGAILTDTDPPENRPPQLGLTSSH
jgi:hypothetical protein